MRMETEYMQLGRLRASSRRAFGRLQPAVRTEFRNPPTTTPQYPQNLLRQTFFSGARTTGRFLAGLGQAEAGTPTGLSSSQTTTLLTVGALSFVSAVASAYHGYRRDRRPMSAVGWGFMGAIFPVITPTVALAQGYAKPRKGR